jgi:uncharacterized membrane protein YoaK (UPF0700 family)
MLHSSALPTSVSSCWHLLAIFVLLLCLCMHTLTFSSSLRYAFFSMSFFCVLCSVHHFHSLHYASSMCFISCAQLASSRMNYYQNKKPSLLCFAYIYHSKSSAISYTQLFILSSDYTKFVIHQWSLSRDSLASLEVTVLDTFPYVNCLYDESSFHWQLP